MKFITTLFSLVLVTGLFAGEIKHLQYDGLPYCQALENPNATGRTTLILLLHGRSRCGSDNEKQLDQKALSPILNEARESGRKVLVLIPQCPAGKDWLRNGRNGSSGGRRNPSREKSNSSSDEQNIPGMIAVKLVKEKMKEFNVPSDRAFISGFSMGGAACYGIMMRVPDLFSKALIVSTGGRPQMAAKLKGSFYLVQGEKDDLFPPSKVKSMADALRGNPKCRVQLKIASGKDHSGTADVAYTHEILTWLFQ